MQAKTNYIQLSQREYGKRKYDQCNNETRGVHVLRSKLGANTRGIVWIMCIYML